MTEFYAYPTWRHFFRNQRQRLCHHSTNWCRILLSHLRPTHLFLNLAMGCRMSWSVFNLLVTKCRRLSSSHLRRARHCQDLVTSCLCAFGVWESWGIQLCCEQCRKAWLISPSTRWLWTQLLLDWRRTWTDQCCSIWSLGWLLCDRWDLKSAGVTLVTKWGSRSRLLQSLQVSVLWDPT